MLNKVKLNYFLCPTIFSLIFYINICSQWDLRINGLPEKTVGDVLATAKDSSVITCANDSPLYISNDLANHWISLNSPQPDTYSDASIINKNRIWFCTWDGKIFHTNDGGTNWELQYTDTNKAFLNFIKFFDKDNGIVVGDAIDNNSPAVILKTIDGGNNWLSINKNYLIGVRSRDVFYPIEFPSKLVGYYCDYVSNKLFKTEDGGVTWNIKVLPSNVGQINMIKFYNEKIGMLVNLNYSGESYVFRTLDGGVNWEKLSLVTTFGIHDIEFLPSSPAKIWLSNYDNLYFSSDTGNTWQQVKVKSGSLEAHNIEFLNDSIGFILCRNFKVYTTENNGGIITFVEKKKENIVSEYKLYQNYPNPFNPITKIKYYIPEIRNEYIHSVRLTVYDVLGNLVEELVNENKYAGLHEVAFNANNLSTGIYFYQIKSGNYMQIKKMILLR